MMRVLKTVGFDLLQVHGLLSLTLLYQENYLLMPMREKYLTLKEKIITYIQLQQIQCLLFWP